MHGWNTNPYPSHTISQTTPHYHFPHSTSNQSQSLSSARSFRALLSNSGEALIDTSEEEGFTVELLSLFAAIHSRIFCALLGLVLVAMNCIYDLLGQTHTALQYECKLQ